MQFEVGDMIQSPWTKSHYLLTNYDPQTDCFECLELSQGEPTIFTQDMIRRMKASMEAQKSKKVK